MSNANSTPAPSAGKTQKPNKPYPDFPRLAHATCVWEKNIPRQDARLVTWGDPDAALKKYLEQKGAPHAGKKPRDADALTVKEFCNRFLNVKRTSVDSGELTHRSWQDDKDACMLAIEKFGKSRFVANLDPDDFQALRKSVVGKGGASRRQHEGNSYPFDRARARRTRSESKPHGRSCRRARAHPEPRPRSGMICRTC